MEPTGVRAERLGWCPKSGTRLVDKEDRDRISSRMHVLEKCTVPPGVPARVVFRPSTTRRFYPTNAAWRANADTSGGGLIGKPDSPTTGIQLASTLDSVASQ